MSEAQGPRKRITLADVAREAGVSIQTASHVLSENMTVRLPDATRQRVKEAAERIGYRPNRLAQAMKRGRSKIISVWMPVDRPLISYLRQLHAIHSQVRADGYELMITGLEGAMAFSAAGELPYVWPVDGIIAVDAGKALAVLRQDSQYDSIPLAVLGFERFPNSDSVGWDVAGASREVTQRLIDRGQRNIVHLTLDWILEGFPREQRRRGYVEAMTQAGLQPQFVASRGESGDAAEQALDEWMRLHGVPEGICCFTDALALGAIRALCARGLEVPRDCKVWGFGDFPESEDARVPLSSIAMPIPEVMDQAWTWMKERIDDPQIEPRFAVLPMKIIERESARW
jgi:DNA-binding LacI/PurR family transcriptional regulator